MDAVLPMAGVKVEPQPQGARFTWTIDHFSQVNLMKIYSDVFEVGGYKWRVIVYPKGNGVDFLSTYLAVADAAFLPHGWCSRITQFSLAVVNQLNSNDTKKKGATHQFKQTESDWGFTTLLPVDELYNPSKGYIVNDKIILEADVYVSEAPDSMKVPNLTGIKNQETSGNNPHFQQFAGMSVADVIRLMCERQKQTHDRVMNMQIELQQQGEAIRRLSEHLGLARNPMPIPIPPPVRRVQPSEAHVPMPMTNQKN